MDVFIGNLSPRTTLNDLVVFFKGFASDTRFQIFDKQFQDGSRSRYAMATIEPDRLAGKVIKKLNGADLHGNTVVLREYLYRSYGNERRAVRWRNKPWKNAERRDDERRRKLVEAPIDFETFVGIKKSVKEDAVLDLRKIKVEARSLFARKL